MKLNNTNEVTLENQERIKYLEQENQKIIVNQRRIENLEKETKILKKKFSKLKEKIKQFYTRGDKDEDY